MRQFVMMIIVALLLSGCMTAMLWEDSPNSGIQTTTYSDTIESFMVTHDGSKMVFASQKYHYILESDPALVFLLSHKDELAVRYAFPQGSYGVYNGAVNAMFSATLNLVDIDPQLIHICNERHYGNFQGSQLLFSFNLHGTRYQSDPKINAQMTHLHTPITLEFRESTGPSEAQKNVKTLTKVALTPLTLAADGAIIILGVILESGLWIEPHYHSHGRRNYGRRHH